MLLFPELMLVLNLIDFARHKLTSQPILAALESVLPASELATFVTLTKREKYQQIKVPFFGGP